MTLTLQIQGSRRADSRLDIQSPLISISLLSGEQITPYTKEMGELIMGVYKEWPYLYAGTTEEMQKYVQERYIEVPTSVVCAAFAGDRLVGLSMGVPLPKAPSHYLAPFTSGNCLNYPLEDVFYWGEIVVRPEFRRNGIASTLSNQMINQAMQTRKYKAIALCAIERSSDFHLSHLRPVDYFSTDSWWKKLGFTKHGDLILEGIWHLVGEQNESKNPMTFWIREQVI